MLEKLRKNNKKGFTLVELIVVLVILAILAALLIPALTGYIDKAKEKQIIAKTRQIVMAAQTLVDEEYGTLALDSTTEIKFVTLASGNSLNDGEIDIKEVETLAEVKDLVMSGGSGTANVNIKVEKGKVKVVKYAENGMVCTYEEGTTSYETEKPSGGNIDLTIN